MDLIDENYSNRNNSKKIIVIGVSIILVLIMIVVGLLTYLAISNNNKMELIIENKKCAVANYLMEKDDIVYISIENLTKVTNNGYNFKTGGKDIEDDNQCYVTNSYESTFFRVGSKQIYKVLEETDEYEFYELEAPIIKENNKIYMPISAIQVAMNMKLSQNNNKYNIKSIGYIEATYNKNKSNNFNPDDSIVWETTYSNKKMLKDGLVIIKDSEEKLGIGYVTAVTDGKSKSTTVSTTAVITPKYDDIKYIEKYNQCIVTLDKKKGVIQLSRNGDSINAKTIINVQYENVKPISDNLFMITVTKDEESKKVQKYGVVRAQNGKEETILKPEYDKIGIDFSKFTNNSLTSEYVIYDSLIPVKKGGLWGLSNLNGGIALNIEYADFGDSSSNPNSNVIIIPDVEGIIVKKDGKYGIISKSGKVLVGNSISKVYKETVDNKEKINVIVNNKTLNVLDYIKSLKK